MELIQDLLTEIKFFELEMSLFIEFTSKVDHIVNTVFLAPLSDPTTDFRNAFKLEPLEQMHMGTGIYNQLQYSN